MKNIKKWARHLHIYLSVFGFILFFLFGLTGFMLNHDDWFGLDETVESSQEIDIPVALCEGPDKIEIIKLLQKEYGVKGFIEAFEVTEEELHVMFNRPAMAVDVLIDRESGEGEILTETSNLLALLTEIHKGEDSGNWGSLIVDVTSILFLFASVSGLFLFFTLPKRRRLGLFCLLGGGLFLMAFVIYILN